VLVTVSVVTEKAVVVLTAVDVWVTVIVTETTSGTRVDLMVMIDVENAVEALGLLQGSSQRSVLKRSEEGKGGSTKGR
jgi:hypothetical protein